VLVLAFPVEGGGFGSGGVVFIGPLNMLLTAASASRRPKPEIKSKPGGDKSTAVPVKIFVTISTCLVTTDGFIDACVWFAFSACKTSAATAAAWPADAEVPKNGSNPTTVVETPSDATNAGSFLSTVSRSCELVEV